MPLITARMIAPGPDGAESSAVVRLHSCLEDALSHESHLLQICVSEPDGKTVPRLVEVLTILLQDLLPTSSAQLANAGADPIVFLMRPFLTAFLGKWLAVLAKLFLLGRRFTDFRLFGLSGLLGFSRFRFIVFHQVLIGDGMLSAIGVPVQISHPSKAHTAFFAMVEGYGFGSFFRMKRQVLVVGLFVIKRLVAFRKRAWKSFFRTMRASLVLGFNMERETRF